MGLCHIERRFIAVPVCPSGNKSNNFPCGKISGTHQIKKNKKENCKLKTKTKAKPKNKMGEKNTTKVK